MFRGASTTAMAPRAGVSGMSGVSRTTVVAIAVGYLIGTFPTADLAARRASRRQGRSIDLRRTGSGNPGGANAMKVLGTAAGVAVMAGDIAKGAAACVAGGVIAGPVGGHAAGTAAVVGHCLPVWNGGRGGKGVAAGVGQCLATFPAYFPVDVAVAAATMAIPRWRQRSFAASVASCGCWVLGAVVWWRRALPNLWGPRPSLALPLAAIGSSAVIIARFATARPPASSESPESPESPALRGDA